MNLMTRGNRGLRLISVMNVVGLGDLVVNDIIVMDGRRYLALVEFRHNKRNDEIGDREWHIVHWGTACGFSDPHGTPGWINQGSFKLRAPFVLLQFVELDNIIATMGLSDISQLENE